MGTELPPAAAAICFTGTGIYTNDPSDCEYFTNHGTAVAEAVIDVAPEASIYISNPKSRGDLQTAVDWMVERGVQVIVHSVVWVVDGPGDGTSPFSNSPLESVDAAVSGGILWVNAAGNREPGTPGTDPSATRTTTTTHNFTQDDDANRVVTGYVISAFLRWDDSWTAADCDLDLHVRDQGGNVVRRSANLQEGLAGDIPYEYLRHQVQGGNLRSGDHKGEVRRPSRLDSPDHLGGPTGALLRRGGR